MKSLLDEQELTLSISVEDINLANTLRTRHTHAYKADKECPIAQSIERMGYDMTDVGVGFTRVKVNNPHKIIEPLAEFAFDAVGREFVKEFDLHGMVKPVEIVIRRRQE